MITVNGHNFRTLADPIYVNNTVVKQAWTAGKMVYPVGDYIKLKYYINQTYVHTHDRAVGDGTLDIYAARAGRYGPCQTSFTVKGVGIEIIKRGSNYSNRAHTKSDVTFSQNEDHDVGRYFSHAPSLCNPRPDAETLSRIKIDGVGSETTEMFKMKFHLSSIPICAPFEYPVAGRDGGFPGVVGHDSDNMSSHYETYGCATQSNGSYFTHLIGQAGTSNPGLSALNDRVFAYDKNGNYEAGEIVLSRPGYYNYVALDGNAGASSSPCARIMYYAYDGWIMVDANRLLQPVNITRYDGSISSSNEVLSESSTDLGIKYIQDFTRFHIPAVEVLYSGDKADAPAEAKTISNSELSLD